MGYVRKLRQRSAALKGWDEWKRVQDMLTGLRSNLLAPDEALAMDACLVYDKGERQRAVDALLVVSRAGVGYITGTSMKVELFVPIENRPNDEGRAFYMVDGDAMELFIVPGRLEPSPPKVVTIRDSGLYAIRLAERLCDEGLDAAVGLMDEALSAHALIRPYHPR